MGLEFFPIHHLTHSLFFNGSRIDSDTILECGFGPKNRNKTRFQLNDANELSYLSMYSLKNGYGVSEQCTYLESMSG